VEDDKDLPLQESEGLLDIKAIMERFTIPIDKLEHIWSIDAVGEIRTAARLCCWPSP